MLVHSFDQMISMKSPIIFSSEQNTFRFFGDVCESKSSFGILKYSVPLHLIIVSEYFALNPLKGSMQQFKSFRNQKKYSILCQVQNQNIKSVQKVSVKPRYVISLQTWKLAWHSGEGLNSVEQFENLPLYGRANQPYCCQPSVSFVGVWHLRFYILASTPGKQISENLKSLILKDKQNRIHSHNIECAEMQQSSKQRSPIKIKEGKDRQLTSQPVSNISGSLLPMKQQCRDN